MDSKIKELIRDVANKHGISIHEAELIYNTQFDLLKEVMSSANREDEIYHNVRLPGFGVFFYRERMVRAIKEKMELKKAKQ